jgi:hypothetical protein
MVLAFWDGPFHHVNELSETQTGDAGRLRATVEQEAGLAGQERELKAAGCEKVFAERVSHPLLAEIVCKPPSNSFAKVTRSW